MPQSRLKIRVHDDGQSQDLVFDTHDVLTALAIADINTRHGRADLTRDGRVIARLAKRGNDCASFWEVF